MKPETEKIIPYRKHWLVDIINLFRTSLPRQYNNLSFLHDNLYFFYTLLLFFIKIIYFFHAGPSWLPIHFPPSSRGEQECFVDF